MVSTDFPAHWGIVEASPLTETFSSRLWTVRLADGTPAVVKHVKDFDDAEDEVRGWVYLDWRDGEGAVRLIARDGHRMLLEHAGAKTLTSLEDDAATEIAADVLGRRTSESSQAVPAGLQPLRDRFASLFDRASHDARYRKAALLAERLLSESSDSRPLHGDLHHDNILLGERGWLAIDPKGVLGDAAFDAANLFFNPSTAVCVAPERIANMAEVLGRTLRREAVELLDWAVAYGALSASWFGTDEEAAHDWTVLHAIQAVRECW